MNRKGVARGGGQVGPAHPRIKVKRIKKDTSAISIYLSFVCGLKSGPPQQKIIATPLLNRIGTIFPSLIGQNEK
jgi:hypothetical protein